MSCCPKGSLQSGVLPRREACVTGINACKKEERNVGHVIKHVQRHTMHAYTPVFKPKFKQQWRKLKNSEEGPSTVLCSVLTDRIYLGANISRILWGQAPDPVYLCLNNMYVCTIKTMLIFLFIEFRYLSIASCRSIIQYRHFSYLTNPWYIR